MSEVSGIDKAIEKAGGVPALARALTEAGARVWPGSIYHWQKTGQVPPSRVAAVAAVTQIPAAELAPKLAETFGVTV